MKRSRIGASIAVGLVGVGLTGCGGAREPAAPPSAVSAAYISYGSTQDLVSSADLVVEGTVVSSQARSITVDGLPAHIYTVASIAVERVIHGDAVAGDVVDVKQLGEVADGPRPEGGAWLTAGTTYVVFLNGQAPASLLNPHQSAYVMGPDGRFTPAVDETAEGASDWAGVAAEMAAQLSDGA